MAIAAVVGALVALPAVRLTGIELALATAAFAVILDRWIFNTPDIELVGVRLGSFDRDSLPLDRLQLPFLGPLSTGELLFVMTVAFALVHLLLVAVRRSTFGDRLLALRESPAACATLGLDPAATRLAVFSFSAGLAAFGGGLYASTLGSATPSAFDLFQSLPLLLVTVAGGVASTGGAVFAAVVLGAMPAVALTFTALSGVIGLLPGTMGITLGRNPDGIVSDLRHRTMAVWRAPAVLAGVVVVEVALTALWLNGAISGWWGSVAVFLVPFVAARLVTRAAPGVEAVAGAVPPDPVEELGDIEHRTLSDADIAVIDRALGLDEVVVRA
jgi:branched-chain amino acid transport system permease protein